MIQVYDGDGHDHTLPPAGMVLVIESVEWGIVLPHSTRQFRIQMPLLTGDELNRVGDSVSRAKEANHISLCIVTRAPEIGQRPMRSWFDCIIKDFRFVVGHYPSGSRPHDPELFIDYELCTQLPAAPDKLSNAAVEEYLMRGHL